MNYKKEFLMKKQSKIYAAFNSSHARSLLFSGIFLCLVPQPLQAMDIQDNHSYEILEDALQGARFMAIPKSHEDVPHIARALEQKYTVRKMTAHILHLAGKGEAKDTDIFVLHYIPTRLAVPGRASSKLKGPTGDPVVVREDIGQDLLPADGPMPPIGTMADCLANPKAKVLLTGTRGGGALAEYAALRLLDEVTRRQGDGRLGKDASGKLSLITFGAIPALNKAGHESLGTVFKPGSWFTIRYAGDPFTWLNVGTEEKDYKPLGGAGASRNGGAGAGFTSPRADHDTSTRVMRHWITKEYKPDTSHFCEDYLHNIQRAGSWLALTNKMPWENIFSSWEKFLEKTPTAYTPLKQPDWPTK